MNNHVLSLVLLAGLFPTALWAGCDTINKGDPHPEQAKYGKTDLIRTRIDGDWRHYFWRGKDHGQVQYCAPNSPANCKMTWTQSFSRETTWGIGGELGGGTNGSDWLKKAKPLLQNFFNANFSKSTGRIDAYGLEGHYAPGQYIEPVMIQDRRWEAGYFRGGWVENDDSDGYCYDYNDNVRYGSWGAHVKRGSPFRGTLITNRRP